MLTLKNKPNEVLISDLKQMVTEERKLLTEVLHHLKEVEDRRLYLERGYPSLFDFATRELGYSEAAAQRRIQTMRLIREVPEVEGKIKEGKLSLSVASQVQSFFKAETKKRKEPISSKEKSDLVTQLEGTSARGCEKKLAHLAPEAKKPREKTKPLADETTLIQFVADKELMAGIEKLRQLTFHTNPEGRLEELFKRLVKLGLEKYDPFLRKARREQKSLPTSEVKKPLKNRHIPAGIRDKVWLRDQGKCQYQDPNTGRVCGSQYGLQMDHAKPFANGGPHDPANLRLLCRRHNLLAARKVFGDRWMDEKISKVEQVFSGES